MEILIIVLLILFNGVFAMCEIAIVNSRKSKINSDAKKGSKKAQTTLKLIEDPTRFLSTIQVGITLIGILTGLFSGAEFADHFSIYLQKLGMSPSSSSSVAQIIIIFLVTFLSIVFGELVPKNIGLSNSEKIAKFMAHFMTFWSYIMTPVVWLLTITTNAISRLLGIESIETIVTEDEIKYMVAEGKEDGQVQDVEQDIVDRVFSLGDRDIESIMTSRSDVVWFDTSMKGEQIADVMENDLYEVYPVAEGSLDDIKGVVFLKDIFGKLRKEDFDLKDYICVPESYHENMSVYKAMEQMRNDKVGYAFVYDEFGVFQGIITHKDILAGLIGTIVDEEEEPDIEKLPNGAWNIDGQCPFYDFLEYFEMEDIYPEYDVNTLGGLILEVIDQIPEVNEVIFWKTFKFKITSMDGARIDKIFVERTSNNLVSSDEDMLNKPKKNEQDE